MWNNLIILYTTIVPKYDFPEKIFENLHFFAIFALENLNFSIYHTIYI